MNLETDIKEAIDALKRRNEYFPHKWCKEAVKEMHRRGYPIVVGTVDLSAHCELGNPPPRLHYWNYDTTSKKHFDITASQFNTDLSPNKQLPQVAIWSEDEETIYSEIQRGLEPHQVI